jgi:tRNA (guanine-N7-)-methyltransferase
MNLEQLKKFRLRDHRKLPEQVYEQMAQTNPYLKQVHDYPDLLLPHPTVDQIQQHWEPLRKRAERAHVEIGCGSGAYLHAWASQHPQDAFLGFELRFKRLTLAARKLAQAQLTNALLVKDRGELLGEYLPEKSLDILHVNFPDPWPKKNHRKHRLFSSEFLDRLLIFFRPGGELRFKTDHQEYFLTVLGLIQNHPDYKISDLTEDLWNSPLNTENIPTEFERLFKSKGQHRVGFLTAHCQVEGITTSSQPMNR